MENEEKNLGGRPAKFETPEQLEGSINEYFNNFQLAKEFGNNCTAGDLKEYRPTITGLCYHLGFESRQSFYDYEKEEGFSYTIKRARMRIENMYEQMLGTVSTTGAIFALKNFGWHDTQAVDHTSGGKTLGFMLSIKPDKEE